jgi:glutamine---fructose-6-phosphate transaminase (isomerizing)
MCGIVGYVGQKSVVPVILGGLKRLEYRGYDSAGIAVAGNGDGLQIRRAAGKLRNLEEMVRLKPLDGPQRYCRELLPIEAPADRTRTSIHH